MQGLGPDAGKLLWGYLKIRGTMGGPQNKDYSILGSIVGSPDFGKLPYRVFHPIARTQKKEQSRKVGLM